MSYENVLSKLSNKKAIDFINKADSIEYALPFLITNALNIIRDDSIQGMMVPMEDKIGIANMAVMCNDSCFGAYLDIFITDSSLSKSSMDNLLKYGEIEIYKIAAKNGLRDATQSEVEQGIRGLIAENIYPAGQNYYQLLNLMMWAFTGENYYFRKAGFTLTYDDKGNVNETVYQMIKMSAPKLVEMFKFVANTDEFDKVLAIIRKTKAKGGYKYCNYASDEIKESISIKQLVQNIDKMFPRGSDNKDYKKAIGLVIKTNKRGARLTPIEVSFLREVYARFVNNRQYKTDDDANQQVNNELKEKCERLLFMRDSGLIDPKHFAYTIITTLRKSNYTRCSDKQLAYVDNAIQILNNNNAKNLREQQLKEMEDNSREMAQTNITGVLTENEIDDTLKNMLSTGIFEE